jgi:polyhydroxyalkanoic acid synthase PhaR subunit
MIQNFNLFDIWKDSYSQYSNLFDEQTAKEFPAQGIGQLLELHLQFKKLLNETTERYYEFVNLPSINDLAHISSLIVNLDAKVDDLEEFMEETIQDGSGQQQNEIANLKKEMKSLDTKLNQIISIF